MRPDFKLLTILLCVLGLADLAMVPFMIAQNHRTGTPPVPAIYVAALISAATLVSAFGVAQGRRWGFILATVFRVADAVTSVLGVFAHPNAVLAAGGAVFLVASVAAIVLLVRQNPRRTLQGAASGQV